MKQSELYKIGIEKGLFDVDRAGNGIYLAETADDMVKATETLPLHYGSHPIYDEEALKMVDEVASQLL